MESHSFSKIDEMMERVVVVHDGSTAEEPEYLHYTVLLEEGGTRIGPRMFLHLSVEPVADTALLLHNTVMPVRSVSARRRYQTKTKPKSLIALAQISINFLYL